MPPRSTLRSPVPLGQQVQGAIVTGIGGAIAALACAGVQKGFDWIVGKWTGRNVRPVFNVTPTGPTTGGSGQHHAGTAHCCGKQSR